MAGTITAVYINNDKKFRSYTLRNFLHKSIYALFLVHGKNELLQCGKALLTDDMLDAAGILGGNLPGDTKPL